MWRYLIINGFNQHFMNQCFNIKPGSFHVFFRGNTGFYQLLAVGGDAVLGFPGFHFFLGTVRRGIGGAVAAVTIGKHIEQYGTAFFFQDNAFTTVGVDNGQRVVTIHPFGMHLVGVETGTDAGSDAVAHGFATGLTTHAVLVVHDVDNEGQTTLHVTVPQFVELVHGGEGQTFPDGTASH